MLEILSLIQQRELARADEHILELEAEELASSGGGGAPGPPGPEGAGGGRRARDVALLYEALQRELWALVRETLAGPGPGAGAGAGAVAQLGQVLLQEEAADGRRGPGAARKLRARWAEAVGRAARGAPGGGGARGARGPGRAAGGAAGAAAGGHGRGAGPPGARLPRRPGRLRRLPARLPWRAGRVARGRRPPEAAADRPLRAAALAQPGVPQVRRGRPPQGRPESPPPAPLTHTPSALASSLAKDLGTADSSVL